MTVSRSVPVGWEVLPLSRVARLERGKFSARPRNDPKFFGGSIPFIQTGDVRNSGGRVTSYSQTLNEQGLKVSKLFPAGTLFITIAANIGDLGVAEFASACPDSLVAVRPRAGAWQSWLYYALSAEKAALESLATQNAQANLNLAKLNPFPLLVPAHDEQIAIAEALDDASALVSAMERMFAKKAAIKQSLMQQLLSGRTRLAGFTDPWDETSVGELASIVKGQQLSRVDMDDQQRIPVWNGGISPSGFTAAANISHQVVTVSEGGNSCGWVGRPIGPFWLGGHCYALEPRKAECPVPFLYFALKAREPQIMALRVGSGLPNIQTGRLASFRLSIPSDANEAAAIARVLDDAAADVDALRRRIAKMRDLKHGMMQELLTGRTRLPIEERAA